MDPSRNVKDVLTIGEVKLPSHTPYKQYIFSPVALGRGVFVASGRDQRDTCSRSFSGRKDPTGTEDRVDEVEEEDPLELPWTEEASRAPQDA